MTKKDLTPTPRNRYSWNYRAARHYANMNTAEKTMTTIPDDIAPIVGDVKFHRAHLPKDANFQTRRRHGVVVIVTFIVEEYRPGVFRAAAFLNDGQGPHWQIGGFLTYGVANKGAAWQVCRNEAKNYAFVNVVTHIEFKGL